MYQDKICSHNTSDVLKVICVSFSFQYTNESSRFLSVSHMAFYRQFLRYAGACYSYECFNRRAMKFPVNYIFVIHLGTLEIVSQNIYDRYLEVFKHYKVSLANVKWCSDPQAVTVTSQPMTLFTDLWPRYRSGPLPNCMWFQLRICNGFGMPAVNACPSDTWIRTFLGLVYTPILCLT